MSATLKPYPEGFAWFHDNMTLLDLQNVVSDRHSRQVTKEHMVCYHASLSHILLNGTLREYAMTTRLLVGLYKDMERRSKRSAAKCRKGKR